MRYILLIYSEEGVWPPDELELARDESVQLCHKLNDQGQYLGAAPLHPVTLHKQLNPQSTSHCHIASFI